MKLLFEEPESGALESWLAERTAIPLITSELARVEVIRACRRLDAPSVPRGRALLAGLDLVALTPEVVDEAAEVGDSGLRSLDALHLASALSIGSALTAFVAYDLRLAEAARAAGLVLAAPGT